MFSEMYESSIIQEVSKRMNVGLHPEERFLTHCSSMAGILDLNDFYSMLVLKSRESVIRMFELSRSLSISKFGRSVFLYNPIYVSNHCNSRCKYCAYSSGSYIRKRLSDKEIKDEMTWLYDKGFRHVLIVCGQNKHEEDIRIILKSIEIAKILFDCISLEVGSYRQAVCKEFVLNGADTFVVYQETYDKKIYEEMHQSGIKSNFLGRLDAPEIALKAGFIKAGTGVLLGLSDPYLDCLSLFCHVNYLSKAFPDKVISISLPRIRDSKANFKPYFLVNDFDYLKFVAAFRIAFPHIPIYVSTRESSEMRTKLFNIGATHFSAGAKTTPGGYSLSVDADPQFVTSDQRDVSDFIRTLEMYGYDPIFKDWDFALN